MVWVMTRRPFGSTLRWYGSGTGRGRFKARPDAT
jgi:hypothetical protein